MAEQSGLPPLDGRRREIMAIIYRFRQKYQYPENAQAYWDGLYQDVNNISAKFGGDPFVADLLAACVCDIERVMEGKA